MGIASSISFARFPSPPKIGFLGGCIIGRARHRFPRGTFSPLLVSSVPPFCAPVSRPFPVLLGLRVRLFGYLLLYQFVYLFVYVFISMFFLAPMTHSLVSSLFRQFPSLFRSPSVSLASILSWLPSLLSSLPIFPPSFLFF